MDYSPVFEWVCSELEQRTRFARIEARGTVRLALKDAGLEPRSVTASQMGVVLTKLMPAALTSRRVDDAEALCRQLARDLAEAAESRTFAETESAYDIFDRLGSAPGDGSRGGDE